MQDVREDALQLVALIATRFPSTLKKDFIKCSIAMETSPDIDVRFTYNNALTPNYLAERGIIEIITALAHLPGDPPSIVLLEKTNLKGHFTVNIHLKNLHEWFQNQLNEGESSKIYDASNDIWQNDFRFEDDNTFILSSFGKLEFSTKSKLSKSNVNQRALLLKIIVEAGDNGVTANKIKKEFAAHKLKIDNDKIEANIQQINTRLVKKFKNSGIKIQIKNIGSNGIKKLKLSVQLTQKT